MISGVAPILYYYYGLGKEKEVSEEDKKQQNEGHNTNYKDFDALAENLLPDVLDYFKSDKPELVLESLIDFFTNKQYNIYIK